MKKEAYYPVEQPNTTITRELLSAHKQGNALLPQTNFGIVTYTAHAMLAHPEISLVDLALQTPDSYEFAATAKTMRAMHERYHVPEVEIDRLMNSHAVGLRLGVEAICSMLGIAPFLPSETHFNNRHKRQLRVAEMLLNTARRDRLRTVTAHVVAQFDTAPVRDLAHAWRQSIQADSQEAERNSLLCTLVGVVGDSWSEEEHGYAAPFWLAHELTTGQPMTSVRFGAVPDMPTSF